MQKFILFIFSYFFTFYAFSIHPFVRNFNRDVYKAGTQNWNITQNRSNLMYFANNSGLLQFDSKNWSVYPIKNRTAIRSILADNDRIYVGASDEFGYFKENKRGVLEYHSLLDQLAKKPKNINEIWQIHKDQDYIYFQADEYIFKYKDERLEIVPFHNKIDFSKIVQGILFISSLNDGPYMLSGSMFVHIPGYEVLKQKKVCAILPYIDNQVLFVTSLHGVFLFNGYNIQPFDTGVNEFLMKNQVFCATTNGEEIVYGTVQRGIAIQNIKKKDVMYLNTFSGLQNNTVLSMAYDNQNNLWLGLDKGIDCVTLNTPIYNIFESNNLHGAGYASLLSGNTLYFGTNQGLYYTYYPQKNSPDGFNIELLRDMKGQVWFLKEVDGTIFCGNDQGLYTIDGKNIERISDIPGTWGIKKMKVWSNYILGCSYKGLFILKKNNDKWVFSHYLKGGFKEASAMFEEDDSGQIWLSHWQKGVYRLTLNNTADSIVKISLYDKSKGFPTNRNNTFYKINNELVFSSEYGFFSYNSKTDRMVANKKWNEYFLLPPNSIRLKQSKTGDVWCVSSIFCGVLQKQAEGAYRIDSLSYKSLQANIIIGFEDYNFINDSTLIVSTENGFSWVDLNKPANRINSFKVLIQSVVVTQKNESKVSSIVFNNVDKMHHIFKKNQNSLRLEFIAPFYQEEDDIQYSYILEHFDKTWSEYNVKNVKEYTALPQGDYVFRVRAFNSQTAETVETFYSFKVLPAWYETGFAYLLYAFFIVLLAVSSVILIKRKIKENAAKIKKQKELEILEQKLRFDTINKEKGQEIVYLKNQKLESELKHKSQELANSTMNLMRKNEILTNLNENLSKIMNRVEGKPENNDIWMQMKNIEHEIKLNIENDDNWNIFEDNFDAVYGNYLRRLSELYPSINLVEKKICAYLKMGLSSKEISALLNLSIRSIETTRYRIRKKLDLSRDTNLTDFLQKF